MGDAFDTFLAKCQTLVNPRGVTLSVERGRRFARIVETQGTHRSVFAFVEIATGDVLKAASFKIPAKHARGNIHDESNGMSRMTEYGPEYLR